MGRLRLAAHSALALACTLALVARFARIRLLAFALTYSMFQATGHNTVGPRQILTSSVDLSLLLLLSLSLVLALGPLLSHCHSLLLTFGLLLSLVLALSLPLFPSPALALLLAFDLLASLSVVLAFDLARDSVLALAHAADWVHISSIADLLTSTCRAIGRRLVPYARARTTCAVCEYPCRTDGTARAHRSRTMAAYANHVCLMRRTASQSWQRQRLGPLCFAAPAPDLGIRLSESHRDCKRGFVRLILLPCNREANEALPGSAPAEESGSASAALVLSLNQQPDPVGPSCTFLA